MTAQELQDKVTQILCRHWRCQPDQLRFVRGDDRLLVYYRRSWMDPDEWPVIPEACAYPSKFGSLRELTLVDEPDTTIWRREVF